jgi:CheY-like chemotaxis protein
MPWPFGSGCNILLCVKLGDPEDERAAMAAALHEVSNALTVVVGWLELARGRVTNHDAAAAIEVARSHAELGRRLARSALGAECAADPERDACDLALAVARAVEPQAAGKDVRVRVVVPRDLELLLPHPSSAMEVLLNLLFNAVAFSPDGGEILLEVEGGAHESDCVRFTVKDQGPGVDEARASLIFEERNSTRPGGIGLGLPHSQRLAESLGGRLRLAGPGRGACFHLEWPTTQTPSGARHIAPRRVSLDGMRVAVLEDDAAVRALLELGLAARGAHVHCIDSADDIERLSDVHVALVDLSPIEHDPVAALERLLARGNDVRVFVISGAASGVPAAIAERVLGCIYKPFELGEIVDRIAVSEADLARLVG